MYSPNKSNIIYYMYSPYKSNNIYYMCVMAYYIINRVLRSVFKIVCLFCGLDPGNLKFETVRTNEQHICF